MRLTLLMQNGTKREVNKVYQISEAYKRVYISSYDDPLILREGYVTTISIPLADIVDVLIDLGE
jgi:uncharacterized protein Veg